MHSVYYIGDWAVRLGRVYAETSFSHVPKGVRVENHVGRLFGRCRAAVDTNPGQQRAR